MDADPHSSAVDTQIRDLPGGAPVSSYRQSRSAIDPWLMLHAFYDESPLLKCVLEIEGDSVRILDANRAFADLLNTTPAALRGLDATEFCRFGESELVKENCRRAQASNDYVRFEFEYVLSDGTSRWYSATTSLLEPDREGNPRFSFAAEDITERRKAETALRMSQERYSSLFTNSFDAIFSLDSNGYFKEFNLEVERLTGYSAEELRNMNFAQLCGPEFRETAMDQFEQALAGVKGNMQVIWFTKKGARLDMLITGVPISQNGSVTGHFGIARDVTVRNSVERALREAKEFAEAASQAKDHFLATLSHELRTPLTPVLMLAGAMEKDLKLPQSIRDDFALIRRNVSVEAQLIDDLLDLTRITRGKLNLTLAPMDLHEVARDSYQLLSANAAAKAIDVQMALRAKHHHVNGDPIRLRQVFWNILSNAIKFTGSGGKISMRSLGGAQGFVRVEVSDTGMGMRAEEIERVFDPFAQGDHVKDGRKLGGLGLGLSISRHLVEMHGGTISAKSGGPGKGTTFVVELPLLG